MGLDLAIYGTRSIEAEAREDDHGWTYNQLHTHGVYAGTERGQTAGFVSVLVPDLGTDYAPPVHLEYVGDGLVALRVSLETDSYLFVSQNDMIQGLSGDVPIGVGEGIAWVVPEEQWAVVGGKSLFVDGLRIAYREGGISMRVEWDDEEVRIEPDASEFDYIESEHPWEWAEAIGDCVTSYSNDPGVVRFRVNGSCVVTVREGTPPTDDDDDSDGPDSPGDEDDMSQYESDNDIDLDCGNDGCGCGGCDCNG